MEVANFRSLADLGIDHGFINQTWPLMNTYDELNSLSMAANTFGDHHYQILHSSHQLSENGVFDVRPVKQQKTNSWNSSNNSHLSNPQIDHHHHASPNNYHVVNSGYNTHHHQSMVKVVPKEEIISSSGTMNFPHDVMVSQCSVVSNQNCVFKPNQGGAKSISTNGRLTQAQDHTMTERKRREKLSQRFIQLSALVPGLKKMDKASVLGDAIKYMKQLQEKVKNLEEQTRKKTIESVVFVKKYELHADHSDNTSSNENFSGEPINEPLPEIEARCSDKDVLIRIHCNKSKGILDKTIAEIEKLHLSVINSSVMTFGNSALDITIIAQMDEDFSMAMKDVVKNLRAILKVSF